jgi:branched-chain amino acid transport system substrate-binding protein
MALDLVRESFGLQMVLGGTGSDPEQAVRELRRLIEVEKVPAVIAALSSDEILACAPIAEREHVVLLATIASSESIRTAGDYVFRTTGSGAGEAKVLADKVFSDVGRAKVAVLHSARSFGLSYRDAFIAALLERGGATPRIYSFPDGTFDFSRITRGLKSDEPDAIFVAGGVQEVGLFVRQVRAAGLRSRLYAAGVLSRETFELAGEAADGMIVVDSVWDPAAGDARAQTFVRRFHELGGVLPDYAGVSTYDAAGMLHQVLRDGARSGEEIRRKLSELRGYRGIQGSLAFDRDGEVNLGAALLEVKGGSLRRLGLGSRL